MTTTTTKSNVIFDRSPMPSPLVYAQQADDEINDLKLYFSILDDIFDSKCSDAEKLRKIEYLVNNFEESFAAWTDLAGSVLATVAKLPKAILEESESNHVQKN